MYGGLPEGLNVATTPTVMLSPKARNLVFEMVASRPTATGNTHDAVRFSESVDPTTSQATGNYAVFETATPGNTLPVTAAVRAAGGSTVALTLGSSMQVGVGYTIRVNNVEDIATASPR